tara:strand:+ start:1179 stop:1682 length:504 start_codon:yes stop_codon:yes gene_type:complete
MGEIRMEEVYSALWEKMLYQVGMKYTQDLDQAQEWCQQGFIKVYHNLSNYEEKGSFEGWVRRIIINTILDAKRKKTLPVNTEIPLEIIGDRALCKDDNIHEEYGFTIEDVLKVKNQLSPVKLKVFDMVLNGYKHKEVADELNITEGTSKSTYHRAKWSIRKILTNKN